MPTYPYLAPRKIATTVTSSATLAKGRHTPVDATSGAATLTLPTDAVAGVELSVEKIDATANAVTISGTIRGASSAIPLTGQYEGRTFLSEGAGSWRPVSDHRTASSLSATYARTALQPDGLYQFAASQQVMATPPTITTSAAATITGQTVDLKTDARIRWHGTTRLSTDGTSIMVRGAADGTGAFGAAPAIWESLEFMVDAPALEVGIWNGGSTKPFLVIVDGYRHAATHSNADNAYLKIDFGGRKADGTARRIQFVCDNSYFKEVRLATTDTLFPVQTRRAPTLAILGDSYATGYAANATETTFDGYGQQLARLLGMEFHALGAVSSTGFLKTNSTLGAYQSRVPSIIADNPAVVLVQGSVNDATFTASQVGDAATAVFSALTSGLPNAVRIATGVLSARSFTASSDAAQNAAIKAAAEANGFVFIDPSGWVTGTGTLGAANGTGNSDLYTYSDTIHPTKAGGFYLASRLAGAVQAAVPSLLPVGGGADTTALQARTTAAEAQIAQLLPAVVPLMNPLTMLTGAKGMFWADDPAWTKPADGAAVASWRDASGNAADAVQAAAGNQPLYRASVAALNNHKAIQFDGVDDYLLGPVATAETGAFSIVVVGNLNSHTAGRAFVSTNSGNNGCYLGTTTTQWYLNSGTTLAGGTPTDNVGHLVVGYMSDGATGSQILVDGTSVATGNAGTFSLNQMCLGLARTSGGAAANPLDGRLAYVGVFSGDVRTQPNWSLFKQWVAGYYGLTIA